MTRADRIGAAARMLASLTGAGRGAVSKAAIIQAWLDVDLLRTRRATFQAMPANTTLIQRLCARIRPSTEKDIDGFLPSPTGGTTFEVSVGRPAVQTIVEQRVGRRRGLVSLQRHYIYRIAVGPGRASVLCAAGLKCGTWEEKLILSATQLYADDRLTVLACSNAVRHGRYELRLNEREDYLAIWHAGRRYELAWHASVQHALDSRPTDPAIISALLQKSTRQNKSHVLTAEEDAAMAEFATSC